MRDPESSDRSGWLAPTFDGYELIDDAALAAYRRLSNMRSVDGPLTARQTSLIRLTVSSAVGGLHSDVLREQIRQALACGVTQSEIVEVFQLVCGIGMVSSRRGLPILSELLPDGSSFSEHQREVRARFEEQRGYWASEWDAVLRWNPVLFETHLECSRLPWQSGQLDAVTKELIYVALDAAITVNNESGLKSHMARALQLGAPAEAVVEVLAIASGFGLTSLTVGLQLLSEESAQGGVSGDA